MKQARGDDMEGHLADREARGKSHPPLRFAAHSMSAEVRQRSAAEPFLPRAIHTGNVSMTARLQLVREGEPVPGAGAPATLEEVYRQESRYVAHLALRVLGRDLDIDDVVQDVFVAVSGALGKLRDPAALHAWLGTVTVRIARRRLRFRRLLTLTGFDPQPDYRELVSPDASPEQRVVITRLYAALDDLPAKERVAWTLRHVQGEQLEELARLCECSLATAKRRILAAERALEARFR